MIQSGILTEIKEETQINKAIDSLPQRTFDKIKANVEGYETPAKIIPAGEEEAYIPDITTFKNGRKNYFELAIKNVRIQATLSKWRVLSTLAKMRNGKFYLMVPRGNFAFVQRLIDKYPIDAQIIKI